MDKIQLQIAANPETNPETGHVMLNYLGLLISSSRSESMSTQNQTHLTVEEAQNILKLFSCTDTKSADSPEEKAALREALLLLAGLSDYQILGICADTAEQGLLALKTYAAGLGWEPPLDIANVEGAVYIKFNPKTGLCYMDSYAGTYRGVLVSCQSSGDGGINEMYGHLPLDLFV